MSPLLSSAGRSVGKLLEGYKTSTLGKSFGSGSGDEDESPNYYGNEDDGAFNSTGNVSWTVLNKNGSYDGDMVVKHFTDFTINSGHTVTTDQPCRGLLIFVTGNLEIKAGGTLTMKGRGALGNPASNGASDNNAVQASGLQLPVRTAGGTDTLNADSSLANGFGDEARSAANRFPDINGSNPGQIIKIDRSGGADSSTGGQFGNNPSNGAKYSNGNNGGTNGTGGGGQGSCGYGGDAEGKGTGGTCFGGGSGGGGGNNNGVNAQSNATSYGGKGGNGLSLHTARCTGGAGNPNGTESTTGGYGGATNVSNGESGNGGILILMVKGTVINAGTIAANGSRSDSLDGNGYEWCSTGAGSGGGAIRICHRGTMVSSGSITVAGGVAGTVSDDGQGRYSSEGGNGGIGSYYAVNVL